MRLPLILAALLTSAALAATPPVIVHDAVISFDIDAHTVSITDQPSLDGADGPVVLDQAAVDKAMQTGLAGETHTVDLSAGPLRYGFFAHQPTDEVTFSRENVGGEISATIGAEGIYVSGEYAWLPAVDGAMHAGRFVVETPSGWMPVMSGRVVSQDDDGSRRTTTYEIDPGAPVDGLSLVANSYTVTERQHGDLTMRICLLEPDERLTELYLERTAFYLDLYTDMIGPYPYDAFTTVENWFPTGYGMPGWTLLGAQVIRLPFIPYTSFGHEIAHNWWGNGVFVDPAEGNWCEGVTVYCADYEYKRQESDEAAREYRRNQLKDYAAYIGGHPERDFALAGFKARHSGATRAVGYGKSMAVWRMLEVQLGRETVLASLQRVYREHRGQPARWSDFFAALEAESGADLSTFQAQWIELVGAPTISLGEVRGDKRGVTFTLHQEGDQIYDLHIPVRVDTYNGPVDETVHMTEAAQTFHVSARAPQAVSIDPDYDVFRHLHAGEIEPTLSRVLAADEWAFVSPPDDMVFYNSLEAFAREFCECESPEMITDGGPRAGFVNVVLNPDRDLLAHYLPDDVTMDGPEITLGGRSFNTVGHDVVFAAPGLHGGVDLVILTSVPHRLPDLAGRLGHYGKYSWLVFPSGGGRAVRGNWTPEVGPLFASVDY